MKNLNYIKALIIIFVSFAASASFAQPIFEYAKQFGGTEDDWGEDMTTDLNGNVYITGNFYGTVDFDPGAGVFNLTSAASSNDTYILKLDSNDNFVWAKQLSNCMSTGIKTDLNGDVYTIGYMNGAVVDFDPGVGIYNLSATTNENYILKLNSSGNFVWVRAFTATASASNFAINTNGQIYTTGYFQGTVDFDPGSGVFNLTSNGSYDIFIQKLDSSGNFIWAKSIGGTGADYGGLITTDASDNIYISGSFDGTVDFDTGSGVSSLTSTFGNYFITKLDNNDDFVWAKSYAFGSSSIAIDLNGSILCTGSFGGTVDFNPTAGSFNLTATGARDIFICKLDSNGYYQFAKNIGAGNATALNDIDAGRDIIADDNGNIYIIGVFSNTVDFDPSLNDTFNLTANYDAAFVLKLDSNANFKWAGMFGPTNTGYPNSINKDINNFIYIAGTFSDNNNDFDPTNGIDSLIQPGQDFYKDAFLIKMSECPTNTSVDTHVLCGPSFTWIDGINYIANNNSATFTYTTANVCDSIVTLNLTLNNTDNTDAFITACDSFTWIDGVTYTTNTSNQTHTLTNVLGCDSVITLYLTIATLSAPTITATGNITPCGGGGTVILSVPNTYSTYSWSTGGTSSSDTVSTSGSYFVAVTDNNGCEATTSPYTVNASFATPPDVCIVGVDFITNYNRIVWEKPISTAIDSFYVYKESNQANVYVRIGGRSYQDTAVLDDVNSNPQSQAYRYKISLIDSCGIESSQGAMHKSIHLTIGPGIGTQWNLIWSHYEGITFASYNIYRGPARDSMVLLTTIASNLNSYTDVTASAGQLYYQIEALSSHTCDPTKSNYNSARSNFVDNTGTTSIAYNLNQYFRVYPNPTKDVINIERQDNEKIQITLIDQLGRVLKQQESEDQLTRFKMGDLLQGIYYMHIRKGKKTTVHKIVKQ